MKAGEVRNAATVDQPSPPAERVHLCCMRCPTVCSSARTRLETPCLLMAHPYRTEPPDECLLLRANRTNREYRESDALDPMRT